MELALPSSAFKTSFIEAVKEFQKDDDSSNRSQWYRALSIPQLEADFEAFVQLKLSNSRGENLPEGHIPSTEYWLVDGEEYIGRASVRHGLTDKLMQIGGHIGYDIRPSKRGHGYGNIILELSLKKALELGINRALVTCDIRNTPSRKVIEKNGGVFENQVPNPEVGFNTLRYWIDIAV